MDIIGSYRCECQDGYIRRHDGICGNYLTRSLLFIYECYCDFYEKFYFNTLILVRDERHPSMTTTTTSPTQTPGKSSYKITSLNSFIYD